MERFKDKKLLVLGGAAYHAKLVEAANRMGVHTIVADYLEPEESPAKQLAKEHWLVSITDVDLLESLCRDAKVDGVLNMCIDPAQRPYSQLAERLNLPCYGTPEQFFIMTDKHAFKEFCMGHNIDVIPEYSEEELLNGEAPLPVMIKPIDSRGSRGQTVVFEKKDIAAALEFAKSESSNGEVMVEKFMGNHQDFSMTYFVVNGTPYLTRVCDRYVGKPEDNLNKQCVGCIAPSKYADFYLKNVHNRMVEFIKALGIVNGPVFMQGFIDGDTVRFYDPGLRCPGGEYEKLLRETTGADAMSLLVEFALTGEIKEPIGFNHQLYLLGGHHTIQLPITARGGVIGEMKGLSEIAENPYVTTVIKRYGVGDTVPSSGDVRQRICEFALITDEKTTVKNEVEWIFSKLSVLDSQGKNMLVSLVDTNKLDY